VTRCIVVRASRRNPSVRRLPIFCGVVQLVPLKAVLDVGLGAVAGVEELGLLAGGVGG